MVDFLTKEWVGSYDYNSKKMNNTNKDYSIRETIIDGRTYFKRGQLCVNTLVFNVFKCQDSETHKHIWVAFGGMSKQHPHDEFDYEKGVERASEKSLIDPEITIRFDHYPDGKELREYAEYYLGNTKRKFVATKEEIEKYYKNNY